MPIRPLECPLTLTSGVVFRGPGDYVFSNNPSVVIKKDIPGPTQVTLPQNPGEWQMAFVKDGKDDAATNNITIVGFDSELIDGAASFVLVKNGGAVWLVFDGAAWGVLVHNFGSVAA